jgi:type IV pilus assembly protein PilC
MQLFDYRARDVKTGKVIKGNIQADTERAAGKLLIGKGLSPISIKGEGEGAFSKLLGGKKKKVNGKDKIVFTRQFATLISAGLPLANSLRTVADQTQDKAMKSVIEGVLADVEAGKPLVDAFAKYPQVFDKVYLSLIAAGEMSGTLDESLKRVAAQQEKDSAMMSKIRGAMTYPAIVLVVILLVVAFMLFTVVPQVESLYNDLKQPLPIATAIMVAGANFLLSYWWLVIIVVVAVVGGFVAFMKTKTGIRIFALFKLNVPLFKKLFQRLYMARFARTAQILLATGVAMLDALRISGDAVNNEIVKKSIDDAAEMVKGGKALSVALKDKPYVMPLVPQMISIGEQSGKIDEMLGKAAQVYEDELDEQIRTISTMIEPILMVFLAVVAGGMIAAILFPIYSLVNSI